MIDSYFGAVTDGTLNRLKFFRLFLLVNALWIALGLSIGFFIGAAENLVGGDLQTAQALLREKLAVPFVVVLACLALAFLFALLNIMAKRIRDVGLPGWIAVIAIVALLGAVMQVGTDEVQQGASALLFLALVLVPGRSAGSETHRGSTQ